MTRQKTTGRHCLAVLANGDLDLFFDAFENLERNESYANSWLLEARHPKNQRVDYVEQLKALMQDMSMIFFGSMGTTWFCYGPLNVSAETDKPAVIKNNACGASLGGAFAPVKIEEPREYGYLYDIWTFQQYNHHIYLGLYTTNYTTSGDLYYYDYACATRVGVKRSPPILEKYRKEPPNEDGTLKHLPYEYMPV
ncbi:hypothetical protein AAVH_27005 [Aphelenchoides avenae]|nr:hypothetical protein AAVH_27005 [Aphelenchus avenae]